MACNENIIKNMANEVTRNCQTININVESEFVAYLIELLLLNPKYGKLFTKTLNRNNLAYFVDQCAAMIARGGTPLNTLKMQFIMRSNYENLDVLIEKRLDQVDECLKPVLHEILDPEPDLENVAELKKIYRRISIYIILFSGLGSPSMIMNLKESIAALESVFPFDELVDMVQMPRVERQARLDELVHLVSGVRLFNRDCEKGGEMIPDLPMDLVDAGKACLAALSNSLIAVMRRVNRLTTAIDDCLMVDKETGKVMVNVKTSENLTLQNYQQIFDLLIFNRQYEIFIRRLLADIETMVATAQDLVEKYKHVLAELHSAMKYKTAVPCEVVFPLFIKIWDVWRAMQNTMYLVSTVNRLMAILNGIQDHSKIPYGIIDRMLVDKTVATDEERMNTILSLSDRVSIQKLGTSSTVLMKDQDSQSSEPKSHEFSATGFREKQISLLGFCVMGLNVGALIPSNLKIGVIANRGNRYGFSSIAMAAVFNKEPNRYVNEVIQYAREHPQIINLLNMDKLVRDVKDIDPLVVEHISKKKIDEKIIQTELHPVEEYIEHNYTWDLWEWKRRACQWANIVNCKTHSTQTNYSHMRSEIHCQTTEPRDKCLQTMKETGINTNVCNFFVWGLRGQRGDGQHMMDMVPKHEPEKAKPEHVFPCECEDAGLPAPVPKSDSDDEEDSDDDNESFYFGRGARGASKEFYRPNN